MTQINSINVQQQIKDSDNVNKETKTLDHGFSNLMKVFFSNEIGTKGDTKHSELIEDTESENLDNVLEESNGMILFNLIAIHNTEEMKVLGSKEIKEIEDKIENVLSQIEEILQKSELAMDDFNINPIELDKSIQMEESLFNNNIVNQSGISKLNYELDGIVNETSENQLIGLNEFNKMDKIEVDLSGSNIDFSSTSKTIATEGEISIKNNEVEQINMSNLLNEVNQIINKISENQLFQSKEVSQVEGKLKSILKEIGVIIEQPEKNIDDYNIDVSRTSRTSRTIGTEGELPLKNNGIVQSNMSDLLNEVNEIVNRISDNQLLQSKEITQLEEKLQNILKEIEATIEKPEIVQKNMSNFISEVKEIVDEISKKQSLQSKELNHIEDKLQKVVKELVVVSKNLEVNVNDSKVDLSIHSKDELAQLKEKELKGIQTINLNSINGGFISNSEESITNTPKVQSEIEIDNLDEIVKELHIETKDLNNGEKSTMKIKLKPQELGELSVQLEKKDNEIVAKILVQSNDTKQLIQKNVQFLHDSIGNNNVKIIEIRVDSKTDITQNFSFDSQGENSSNSNNFFNEQNKNGRNSTGEFNEENYNKKMNNKEYSNKGVVSKEDRNINILI